MRTIQAVRNRRAWIVASLIDTLAVAAAMLLLWLCVESARGDCVIYFSANWCTPCQRMKPVAEQLQREGFDIRPVDVDARPDLKIAYRVVRVPTFVYVAETPTGNYELGRLSGLQADPTLRRFCQSRRLLYDPAPVANCIRLILGLPILVGAY